MKKLSWFQQLKIRLSSESPKFFKKFARFGVWLSGLSGAILGANIIPGIVMPEVYILIASHCAVAGLIIAFVAKSTTKDPEREGLPNP